MQWANEPHAGFSSAENTVHPVIRTGPYSCDQVNVEAQRREPGSLLNWTARMIRLRKETPEIGWGTWEILKTKAPSVLALRYDWRGNSVITLHNFADQPQEVKIRPEIEGGDVLVNLLTTGESRAADDGQHRISIEAYGYRWYRVGGLNYVLNRGKA
jgi:maltose alpha-D-glucosyltransferase/alpha-amylase